MTPYGDMFIYLFIYLFIYCFSDLCYVCSEIVLARCTQTQTLIAAKNNCNVTRLESCNGLHSCKIVWCLRNLRAEESLRTEDCLRAGKSLRAG